jgi:hypothetical protein
MTASQVRTAGAGLDARPGAPEAVPASVSDAEERLFWTLMGKFEKQALEHYRAELPALATAEKERFVTAVESLVADDVLPADGDLAEPIERLLRAARNGDPVSTLIVQGLTLERLGQAIYRLASGSEAVSAESRRLVGWGLAASESVTSQVPAEITARVGTHETLYAVFASATHDVLGALDAVGEPVDRIFGERFHLRFADVISEFAADLIGVCVDLGMQRRKVVAQLAGAVMGL